MQKLVQILGFMFCLNFKIYTETRSKFQKTGPFKNDNIQKTRSNFCAELNFDAGPRSKIYDF